MKAWIWWRTIKPLLLLPFALIAIPLLTLWMFVRYPREAMRAWRQSRDY